MSNRMQIPSFFQQLEGQLHARCTGIIGEKCPGAQGALMIRAICSQGLSGDKWLLDMQFQAYIVDKNYDWEPSSRLLFFGCLLL